MSSAVVTITDMHLTGIRLFIARSVFILLVLITLIFFGMGVPLFYEREIQSLNANTLVALHGLGMSITFYAAYQTSLVVLLAIGFTIAGIIIYWFKSDEWLALLVAFTLIGQGANAFGPLQRIAAIPNFEIPARFIIAMVLIGLPLSCYLFPDGKIHIRWMLYVAGIWFVWLIVSVFWHSLPINIFNRGGNATLLYLFSLLAVLSTGIYAQVHRYIHTDSLIKRKQLKWVVFGIAVAVSIGNGSNIFLTFFEKAYPPAGLSLFVNLITDTISIIAQFSVPVAVVFSIFRYQLYGIELIINRSLVYGSLTVLLVAIFGGILSIIHGLFENFAQGPLIAVAISAAIFGSLFQPIRRNIQRFVDQRFYNIYIDYQKTVLPIPSTSNTQVLRGTQFGAYQNLQLIGRGGMAEVYKSIHPSLNQPVAIKILPVHLAEEAEFRQRFTREALVISKLEHPNIIRVFDSGEQDGRYYMVMEYLPGKDLSEFIGLNGKLALNQAVPMIHQVAAALDYAHSQGFVHRDIKPSNVLLDVFPNNDIRAILTDFGIAKIVNAHTAMTHTGSVMGSFDYIAPEQIQEFSNVDGRADIYAFGIVVYQMLTGELPFKHNHPGALLIAHLTQPPPDACRINTDLSESICWAIQRAMAKKPEERFSTASEFAAALS